MGYVHTKTGYPNINGYRSLDDVLNDINKWNRAYGAIDGIFVDEVSSLWPDVAFDDEARTLSFYENVIDQILSINSQWVAVLNPGGPYNY